GSASTRSTFLPARARPAARLMAVVVFPTPPFWFAIAMIFAIVIVNSDMLGLSYGIRSRICTAVERATKLRNVERTTFLPIRRLSSGQIHQNGRKCCGRQARDRANLGEILRACSLEPFDHLI